MTEHDVRLIAFYLPQFHRVKENDEWWGEGFTEWTNVKKATPRFLGHAQPNVPAELGYYDLDDPAIMHAQAALAKAYGIAGFNFYYYWFNGRRILEKPVDRLLTLDAPDIPYCLTWANENWTRRWDGLERDVLLAQNYSPEDDLAFINSLLPHFSNPRYIRVNGRPLLTIYRPNLLPEPLATTSCWRQRCQEALGVDPYLVAVIAPQSTVTPATGGFDAMMEFPPHLLNIQQLPVQKAPEFQGMGVDYIYSAQRMIAREMPPYKVFRGVMPAWDNTPRLPNEGVAFVNTHPGNYGRWLRAIVQQTRERLQGDERLVFINAWNEWAEGAYLEPDERYGRGWLEATRASLIP